MDLPSSSANWCFEGKHLSFLWYFVNLFSSYAFQYLLYMDNVSVRRALWCNKIASTALDSL